jgi:TolB protein
MISPRPAVAAALLPLLAAGGGEPCRVEAGGDRSIAWVRATAGQYDVVVSRLDCAAQRTYGGAGDDLSPSWSARGRRLAWSRPAAGGGLELVLVAPGRGAETVVPTPGLEAVNPALSPDGTQLAFEGRVPGGLPDVYVVPVTGGTPAPVAASPARDAGPAWGPDGATLYFVSDRSGQFEVWRTSAAGGAQQVTSGSSVVGRPAVSPAGELAFARLTPDQVTEVATCAVGDDGAGHPTCAPSRLRDADDSEPAWDATGTRLAVRSFARSPLADIVVLDARTGAELQVLTDGAALVGQPAFPR